MAQPHRRLAMSIIRDRGPDLGPWTHRLSWQAHTNTSWRRQNDGYADETDQTSLGAAPHCSAPLCEALQMPRGLEVRMLAGVQEPVAIGPACTGQQGSHGIGWKLRPSASMNPYQVDD